MNLFSRFANRERTAPHRKHPRVPVKPMRREREVLIDFRDAYAKPLPAGPINLDLTPAEREQAAMDQASRGAPLSWLAVDRESFSGRMLERPQRASIPVAAQEQLVVELYSK